MIRKASLLAVAIGAILAAEPAGAQEVKASENGQFTPDPAKVKVGKSRFSSKGCTACHSIGKGKMAGPDLNGLFVRRSEDWIKSWLKDPNAMLATDEQAKEMLKEYKGIKMPNMKLSDADIEALMHYIASEQKPKEK